jgi:hypothetical protein
MTPDLPKLCGWRRCASPIPPGHIRCLKHEGPLTSAGHRKKLEPFKPAPARPSAQLSNAKLQALCTRVADAFGYTLSDVMFGSRQKHIVRARFACYYALRQRGLSFPEIGELLGAHHTSVLSGVRKVERDLKRFPDGETALALRGVLEDGRAARAEQVRRAIAELQTELGALEIGLEAAE